MLFVTKKFLLFTVVFLCIHFSLQEDPPAGVSGAPTENNIMLWNAVIFGYVCFIKQLIHLVVS